MNRVSSPRVSRTIALGIALLLCACPASPGQRNAAEAGLKVAPRLTGKDLAGEYVALDDHRGKVVLLNVWATWCEPCREELPELQRIQATHGGESFTVFGVSIDADRDAPKVRAMAERFRLGYPVMLDPGGKSVESLDVRGYPTTFVLGPDGTILWRRDGILLPRDPEVETQIKAALRLPKA